MKEIAETMERAKQYAIKYIEVPPHARFEIRWSTKEPPVGPVHREDQILDGKYADSGPMLIACLTD